MSEVFPPLYNFNGIDFNADYFAIPNSSSGGGGMSIAYANSHYLPSYSGSVAKSDSIYTLFNNHVGIGNTSFGASLLVVFGGT